MKTKVFLLLILAMLISTLVIFKPGCKAPEKPVIISTDAIAKVEEKVLDEALKKVDSLQDKIISIEAKAAMDEVHLHAEQTRARLIEKTVVKKIFLKDETTDNTSNNYFSPQDLIESSQLRDSLCNSVIAEKDTAIKSLKEIVVQKDTMIQAVKKSNSILATQQNEQLKYTQKLELRFNGVKVGNRLLKIGFVAEALYILKTIIAK